MYLVTRDGEDRVDVVLKGKLDGTDAQRLVDELLTHSVGLDRGRMLLDVDDFPLPAFEAFRVEMARLPELLQLLGRLDNVAVLTDEAWVSMLSNIESKLLPGIVIKTFRRDQRYQAETWLGSGRDTAVRAGAADVPRGNDSGSPA